MSYMKKNNRFGSAFIIVIGILGIIIFAATMFMSSTIHEGRETSMSIRGLHATSLAEAALERAMSKIMKDINNIDLQKTGADEIAVTVRIPVKEKSSALDQSGSLGTDKELDMSSLKTEFEFKKDDLQNVSFKKGEDSGEKKDLDEMVDYMTDKGAKEYEVTVKGKIEHAFRISPKTDYKIPGVDIPWNTRKDVRSLLDGNGYTALHFEFPDSMKWFTLEINLLGSFLPDSLADKFDFAKVDLVGIVSKILEGTGVLTGDNTLEHITTLDWAADKLMNNVMKPIAERVTGNSIDHLYPIDIMFAKGDMPDSIATLWPNGASVSEGDGLYLEKYGQITFDSEAKITYKDGYTASRRINAVKDFKVSDCEPPASMYSFFISNEKNDEIAFNNYGGQFYVNNLSFTNMGKNALDAIKIGKKAASVEEMNNKEFPGLIRVNSKHDKGIMCNIGFLGDWSASNIVNKNTSGGVEEQDSLGDSIGKVVKGTDLIMLVCSKQDDDWSAARGSFEFKVSRKEKEPDSGQYSTAVTTGHSMSGDSAKDALKTALGKPELNVIPKIKSASLIELAICLAVMPLAQSAADSANAFIDSAKEEISGATGGYSDYVSITPVDATQEAMKKIIEAMDCFATWDWPYMGTSNELFTIPNLGRGSNKTHLFGEGALQPTLTKEIEGDVVSQYRQWRMCIVGLKAYEKIYIMGVPIPPIPIPLWKTTTQVKKYGYHITGIKSLDENNHEDDKTISTYDPAKPENMPPNLYTVEQYAKKATYYYENQEAFIEDLPNRMIKTKDGKEALALNGITYIAGSLGSENDHFKVEGKDALLVTGKGMIVVCGNVFLGTNIICLDNKDTGEKTTFSLICRNGGLVILKSGKYAIEGSLYTDAGIYVEPSSSLHILGNWVTNQFKKTLMLGTVIVDYVSSRTRTSVGSLHPTRGKYDPKRYHVSFSPIWSTWRAY